MNQSREDRLKRRIVIEQAVRMCVAVVLPAIERGKRPWSEYAHGSVLGFLAGRMTSLRDGLAVAARIAPEVLAGKHQRYYFSRCRNCGASPVPLGPHRNCCACGEGRPLDDDSAGG